MMPAAAKRDWSLANAPRRVTLSVIVLQVWSLAAYVFTGPVPYLWREAAYPDLLERGVPEWLLAIPALLLIVPGFWIAVFGSVWGAFLFVAGGVTWALCRSVVSARLNGWLLAGTGLSIALTVFALTPLGRDIQIWVLD